MNMNDGGPAFPRAMVTSGHDELTQDKGNTGMTLRDYYAGQAVAGVDMNDIHGTNQEVAEALYQIADALVAEKRRLENEELQLRLDTAKGESA